MKSRVGAELLAAVVFIAFLGQFVALAQHAGHGGGGDYSPPPNMSEYVRTGKAKGKVVEFDRTSLTLEMQKKGRAVRATYQIDDRTKMKGNFEVGAEVEVKYREVPGTFFATSIEVKKPRQTGKAGA
ncbi:MAG: hypothetical protein HY649_00360 [Acidobacteria bacterium]|nr:hypothetical protein [Acidobacteriota bacterium]